MAQVLKEEQKNKILYAAKTQFVEIGFSGTSMRAIAKDAGMTVGNIYRYFKNKKDIANAIISPVLEQLDGILMILSCNSGDILSPPVSVVQDENSLTEILFQLADCMVEIEDKYKYETVILLNDDEINENYRTWLYMLIKTILYGSGHPSTDSEDKLHMMSSIISSSIFAGLSDAVKIKISYDISKDDFRIILRNYFDRCVSMLKF